MNIQTIGVGGFSYFIVEIEADVRFGLFKFDIIGLADKTIEESKLRILSAVRNSHILDHNKMNQKIVILLSPANIKKEGTYFDLPIAIAYLQAINSVQIDTSRDGWISFGELGLKGNIRSVKNICELLQKAKGFGFSKIIIPKKDLPAVEHIQGLELFPAEHLVEVIGFLSDSSIQSTCIKPAQREPQQSAKETFIIDSVEDQNTAVRALTVALAGRHHVLLYGSPGTGKSLLAKSVEEIQQEVIHLSEHTESLGTFGAFRSPHHTISHTELIGNPKKTGEIHKANGGILFLDEISEFNRRALEALRQPLEEGYSFLHDAVSGDMQKIKMSADFMLIGASNRCRCGYFESTIKKCTCTALMVKQYQSRLSGPILDRIDLYVYMNEYSVKHGEKRVHLSGKEIVQNIIRVRAVQKIRLLEMCPGLGDSKTNLDYEKKVLYVKLTENIYKELDDKTKTWFQDLCACLHISKREEASILVTARTVADLDTSGSVEQEHIIETISFRRNTRS